MIIEDAAIVEKINSHLPEQIRVYGYQRANKSFNPKTCCDSRKYEYILPTYMFKPRPMPSDFIPKEQLNSFARTNDVPEESTNTIYDESYRMPKEEIPKINALLAKYKGTHCFQNFTRMSKYVSKNQSYRVIMDFVVAGEPFMMEGVECIRLNVHGQSFMIYQIRKMIGMQQFCIIFTM